MKRGQKLEDSMMGRWYATRISRQSKIEGQVNEGDSEWTAANSFKLTNVNWIVSVVVKPSLL